MENCVHFCPNYSLILIYFFFICGILVHEPRSCTSWCHVFLWLKSCWGLKCGTNFYVSLHASSLPLYSRHSNIVNHQKRLKSLFPTARTLNQANESIPKLSFGLEVTHILIFLHQSHLSSQNPLHILIHPSILSCRGLLTLVYRFLPHHTPVPPSPSTLSLTGVNTEY